MPLRCSCSDTVFSVQAKWLVPPGALDISVVVRHLYLLSQVENLTDCISINHNWCNAHNLPSLYSSMCAKVTEVEHALEDVRELLSSNAAPGDTSWMREWVNIVQDVVEKDAGWK